MSPAAVPVMRNAPFALAAPASVDNGALFLASVSVFGVARFWLTAKRTASTGNMTRNPMCLSCDTGLSGARVAERQMQAKSLLKPPRTARWVLPVNGTLGFTAGDSCCEL